MGAESSTEAGGVADPLTEWVDEFVRALDEGRAIELDALVARAPAGLRDELRARCRDIGFLRGVMPNARSGSSCWPTLEQDFGDLHVTALLARGRLGSQFAARQIATQHAVVLHVLDAHLARLPGCVERFRCAAEAAAQLRHPNIVSVIAFGARGGVHYFVEEQVAGPLLSSELGRVSSARDDVAPASSLGARDDADYVERVCEIAAQLADALAAAHAQRVIHFGVRPHEVVLDRDGRPRLSGFGLSRVLLRGGVQEPGALLGRPDYMSPEWARALPGPIDARSDLFSLGVVLYEMLTLARPFDAWSSSEVVRKLARAEPQPMRRLNRAVPRELEAIVALALEKSPADRYATAAEFAADLRHFLRHEPVAARRKPWLVRGWRRLVR